MTEINKNMMAKIRLVSLFIIFNVSANLSGQTYRHQGFELNSVVSFNVVVNYIGDKSKIITEPSVYTKGEDIKFHDDFNTTTTLIYWENTQMLKGIVINGITNIAYLESLRQTIFQQLGKPIHGYEIKITNDVKDNSLMDDYITFNNRYKYKALNKLITFTIISSGLRGSTKKQVPIFTFSVFSHDIRNSTDLNVDYPSLDNSENNWNIQRFELLNKW